VASCGPECRGILSFDSCLSVDTSRALSFVDALNDRPLWLILDRCLFERFDLVVALASSPFPPSLPSPGTFPSRARADRKTKECQRLQLMVVPWGKSDHAKLEQEKDNPITHHHRETTAMMMVSYGWHSRCRPVSYPEKRGAPRARKLRCVRSMTTITTTRGDHHSAVLAYSKITLQLLR
jgi:hypothetical protein